MKRMTPATAMLLFLLWPIVSFGQNTITVKCSEDYYNGNAAYVLRVDGVALSLTSCLVRGGATAASPQVNTFTGNWPKSVAHTLTVTFTNDASGAGGDRNLYIWSITLDGTNAVGTTVPVGSASGWKGWLSPPGIWAFYAGGALSWSTSAVTPPVSPTLKVVGANVLLAPPAPVTHQVVLGWNPSTSSGVTGYNVYRSLVSGSGYSKLATTNATATSFTDGTVAAATTYFYVITASINTVESSYSNEATAVLP